MRTYKSKKKVLAREATRHEMVETKYGWRSVNPGYVIIYVTGDAERPVADDVMSKEEFADEYQPDE